MTIARHLVDLTNQELQRAATRAIAAAQLPFELVTIGRSPDSPQTVTFRLARSGDARPIRYACPGNWTITDMQREIVRFLEATDGRTTIA